MQNSEMLKILAGGAAGMLATAPMTASMMLMHRALPRREQYPLPPRIITERIADEAGVRDDMDETEKTAATLAAHFGYGGAAGAIYGALADEVDAPPLVKGIAWGLIVWTGSYLGLLPALGILTPATQHPARRSALMIVAHVIWGAALGAGTHAVGADVKGREPRLHPRRVLRH
jgi:uncharacterized membrane protein YagU involved in acid resistance